MSASGWRRCCRRSVDGEADAGQALDLRVHLRQCLACRAAVCGLHDASRPLTVVFPAARLAGASGGVEQTHSFFVRVYETFTMHAHERAANSFLRAQAIVDTVTAGKMAAAAASAAALAGGGVAVEGVLSSTPAATPQALVRRADNAMATALVKAPLKTATHAKRRSHAHASSDRRAGASRGAAGGSRDAGIASGRAAAAATAPRSSSAGAVSGASQHASPPASTGWRASSACTSGAGGSASGEFGFEGAPDVLAPTAPSSHQSCHRRPEVVQRGDVVVRAGQVDLAVSCQQRDDVHAGRNA